MKRIMWLVGFMAWMTVLTPGYAEEMTIRITTGEYTPWTSETLPHDGFVNHVITEAFQRVGYTVEYTYYPWKRAHEQTKDGSYHGTSYWTYSEERAQDFYFTDPVTISKVVFFHLKSTPLNKWNTLDDLHSYTIGVTRGYTYSQEFVDAQQTGKITTDTATKDGSNFQKLLRGRIDLFPADLVMALTILNSEFEPEQVAQLTYHPKPLVESPGMLMIPKQVEQAEELVRQFNQGLAMLKEEGRYEQLYQDLLAGKYQP